MQGFATKYKVLEKIGEGSFSEVLRCEERETKDVYAAKVLKKLFESSNDVLYCAEVIAMQKLSRHPNILYMHEYFFERNSGKLIFIFELMDMSMYEFMKLKKRCISEARVKQYLYQILKGLEYLHRHGLFHRDIKPENILIKVISGKKTYPQEELIKIADLGSIRGIFSKPPYTEYISTRWYRSPECLLTSGHYTAKMDVWATGCVFYEMLTTKPLFPGNNEIDQLAKIHQILGTPTNRFLSKLKSRSRNLVGFPKQVGTGLTPLTSYFSIDAQTILKLMLQYDPDIRSNARRLLQHRYFSDIREDDRNRKVLKHFTVSNLNESSILVHPEPNKGNVIEFQEGSLKSFGNFVRKKPLFGSNTSVDLVKRKMLLRKSIGKLNHKGDGADTDSQRVMRNWYQYTQKYKIESIDMKSGVLRNTTTNLLKSVGGFEAPNSKHRRSKSIVGSEHMKTRDQRISKV